MRCRPATPEDVPLLAAMNQRLIRDEGARNPMSLPELEQRMAGWLEGEYRAALMEDEDGTPLGYALYRFEPEFLYIRHLYVEAEHRRRGIGRAALEWLAERAGPACPRLRLEVLVHNTAALAFYRAAGCRDHAITLERDLPAPSDSGEKP